MSTNESIYDLIPPPPRVMQKPDLYKSQHGAATGGAAHLSTFKAPKKNMGSMGPAKVPKNNPSNFLRKHEKEMVLPPPVKFQRESAVLDTLSGDALAGSKNSRTEALQRATQRKPAVPSRHEKPLMGIKTSKNFVTANAVDNILSVPNKPLKEKPMTKKAGYGKAPAYLSKVKQQVAEEQEYLREFEAQYEQDYDQGYQSRAFQLSEDERAELLAGMKANWEKLNKAYQTLSFTLDTPAKRVKKEKYEEEMHQLEADIQRLSKPVVLVQE